MKPHFLIFGFLFSALIFSADPVAASPLSDSQRACLQKAERHEKNGWIYLHIEGAPHERGFQYGYLLAKEIAQSLRARQSIWEYTSGMDWSWLVEKSKAMFTLKVDTENLAEIGGIADGLAAAGAASSLDELIAYNGWFELAWYWWPTEKKKLNSNSPNPPKQSCSSFIATGRMTADGGIVLGHNSMIDYPEADFKINLDVAKKFESDHYDSYLGKEHPGAARSVAILSSIHRPGVHGRADPSVPPAPLMGRWLIRTWPSKCPLPLVGAQLAAWLSTPRSFWPTILSLIGCTIF